MKALRAKALVDVGTAADCLAALLEPDPDSDATDALHSDVHGRRTVGTALLAEAVLSLIVIRKSLETLK